MASVHYKREKLYSKQNKNKLSNMLETGKRKNSGGDLEYG